MTATEIELPFNSFLHDLRDYYTLCKPKVVAVMLVTSMIGMLLGLHPSQPLSFISWQTLQVLQVFVCGTLGIALAAASAAVINHLVDSSIDAKMSRTAQRPIASGRISGKNAVIFATILGICGLTILLLFVNVLTAVLSFLTLLGYAVIYTMFLKRATPQNIVIGGAAGAMPPLLGWAAVSNEIHAHALLLVLIIFIWTPPHFWALAIYRNEDYKNAEDPHASSNAWHIFHNHLHHFVHHSFDCNYLAALYHSHVWDFIFDIGYYFRFAFPATMYTSFF